MKFGLGEAGAGCYMKLPSGCRHAESRPSAQWAGKGAGARSNLLASGCFVPTPHSRCAEPRVLCLAVFTGWLLVREHLHPEGLANATCAERISLVDGPGSCLRTCSTDFVTQLDASGLDCPQVPPTAPPVVPNPPPPPPPPPPVRPGQPLTPAATRPSTRPPGFLPDPSLAPAPAMPLHPDFQPVPLGGNQAPVALAISQAIAGGTGGIPPLIGGTGGGTGTYQTGDGTARAPGVPPPVRGPGGSKSISWPAYAGGQSYSPSPPAYAGGHSYSPSHSPGTYGGKTGRYVWGGGGR